MIVFSKADAHIHLFEGGYQGGSLTSRPGVEVDELLCYQSLMKDHHIETAESSHGSVRENGNEGRVAFVRWKWCECFGRARAHVRSLCV